VPAVHRPEPVPDVHIGQRGQLVGERAPDRIVLAGLAGIEPEVLQHDHAAWPQGRDRGPRGRPDGVGGQHDRLTQQLAKARRDRGQGVGRVGGAARPAQV
jgi:hypothetical protein